jgi:hypothetical protein
VSADRTDSLGFTAKLVLVLFAVLAAVGLIWHGGAADAFQRLWHDIAGRPGGPMTFRFILQPAMAAIAAFHDGVKDANTGRSPYFWTVIHRPAERTPRLREGLNSTARIILLGIAMDVIYQYKVLGTLYPGEAIIIALLLAFIPYLLIRGPVTRATLRLRAGRTPREMKPR